MNVSQTSTGVLVVEGGWRRKRTHQCNMTSKAPSSTVTSASYSGIKKFSAGTRRPTPRTARRREWRSVACYPLRWPEEAREHASTCTLKSLAHRFLGTSQHLVQSSAFERVLLGGSLSQIESPSTCPSFPQPLSEDIESRFSSTQTLWKLTQAKAAEAELPNVLPGTSFTSMRVALHTVVRGQPVPQQGQAEEPLARSADGLEVEIVPTSHFISQRHHSPANGTVTTPKTSNIATYTL
ncbi:hypothetical protein K491DRAFT_752818 [Lophiostoma macrostomum CBS 122681]|uniref:Uncharacterized protein n=1 Tax=Lophiostoma macrostomum CBS 122681 TaxID=1314788 RepID=A0A6A6TSW4_9PLEO|nr:hypothetical protein K491DRAFT_752818 [Lophiostoma macrostomum CBS 122681]